MDPLSISASVTALVGAAAVIYNKLQAFKDAPRLISTVADETKTLTSIFSQLDDNFVQGARMSSAAVEQLRDVLSRMKLSYDELSKELEGISPQGKLGIWDRTKWSGKEADMNRIFAGILQQKSSLLLMINIANTNRYVAPSPQPHPSLPKHQGPC